VVGGSYEGEERDKAKIIEVVVAGQFEFLPLFHLRLCSCGATRW